jgi:hypothetical protein
MVDLITMKRYHFQQEDKAPAYGRGYPAELSSQAADSRHAMLEAVAEFDERIAGLVSA